MHGNCSVDRERVDCQKVVGLEDLAERSSYRDDVVRRSSLHISFFVIRYFLTFSVDL